jgi:hypothetical protein
MGDSYPPFSTDPNHKSTGHRLTLVIDYDPSSIVESPPMSPEKLHEAIVKEGVSRGDNLTALLHIIILASGL